MEKVDSNAYFVEEVFMHDRHCLECAGTGIRYDFSNWDCRASKVLEEHESKTGMKFDWDAGRFYQARLTLKDSILGLYPIKKYISKNVYTWIYPSNKEYLEYAQ